MSRPVTMTGRDDYQAALRDLVAAIAEVTAPPYREIGPGHDANAPNVEDLRDLQRDRAPQVASAARHVTYYDTAPDVIHAFARGLRRNGRQPSYPVARGICSAAGCAQPALGQARPLARYRR